MSHREVKKEDRMGGMACSMTCRYACPLGKDSAVGVWVFVFFFLLLMACGGVRPCFADEVLTLSADMQFSYALSLRESGDHPVAVVEWKRFIHFFPEDPRVADARFYLGLSLFHLKKWDEAAYQFRQLLYPFTGSVYNVESFFMLSRTLASQGRFGGARQVLQDLLTSSDDAAIQDRAFSALAWEYLDRVADQVPGALAAAHAAADEISAAGQEKYHFREVVATIDDIAHQKEKTPGLAGALALVPGAGFAYCGRYRDAFAAFLINGGLLWASHASFEEGNLALGILLGVVEAGFYGGSIYGSISSAHKFNRRQIRRRLNRVRRLDSRPFMEQAFPEPKDHGSSGAALGVSVRIPF